MKRNLYFILIPVSIIFLVEITLVLRRQPTASSEPVVAATPITTVKLPVSAAPKVPAIQPAATEPKAASSQSSNSASPSSGKSNSLGSSTPMDLGVRPAFLGGEKVRALVTINGKVRDLISNQIGNYGRVYLKGKDRATINLTYPAWAAQQPVLIQVKDGGEVLNPKGVGSLGQILKLDKSAGVTVSFQAGTQNGIYRLMIQHGNDMKQIDFWVGRPLKVKALAQSK